MRLRTPQTFSQAKMRGGIRSASLHFCFQSSHLLSLHSCTCSLIGSYPLLTAVSCPCCAVNDYPLLTPVSCPGSLISDHFVLTLIFFLYGNLISDDPILTPSVDPTASLCSYPKLRLFCPHLTSKPYPFWSPSSPPPFPKLLPPPWIITESVLMLMLFWELCFFRCLGLILGSDGGGLGNHVRISKHLQVTAPTLKCVTKKVSHESLHSQFTESLDPRPSPPQKKKTTTTQNKNQKPKQQRFFYK